MLYWWQKTERHRPFGKEIQMFNIRFVNTAIEYLHLGMLRDYREGSGSLCSYEIGKTKWLDASD